MVTLTGEPVETDGMTWWPMTVVETKREGWVEADALEPVTHGG